MLGPVMVPSAFVVVGGAVMLFLRRVTLEEAGREAELGGPGAHTVAYAVPLGQDAAVPMAALAHAGFHSVTATRSGMELLLIECRDEAERARVRAIIEKTGWTRYDGAEMHPAHVSFEDEGSTG
ncbi:hypothetical protein [Nocardioides mesophilus]|uniref:Uncharacterized protein n=1 Tax=Nocardioides mesophilus TaxID=433659 RepID=A0A7G9RER7_9ACTN|nr:hypothetical protein [Nocardioides mesophilus]QNN54092.1 hypothetical protein H9L09_06870 [Nocardioides mesophilus]